MKREDCEGCITSNKNGKCIWFDKDLTCPCINCLVKVMCLNECQLLKNHIEKMKDINIMMNKG